MASPLMLALSATAALIAGPALACEGQGCWGMAPAQELNPGYTGPDYSQYGPGPDQDMGPQGPGDMGAEGPGAMGPDGYGPPDAQQGPYDQGDGYGSPPGYGPQGGYGQPDGYPPQDDGYGAETPLPAYVGADGRQNGWDSRGPAGAQAYGYGQQYGGYQTQPRPGGYDMPDEGEPAGGYAIARPPERYGQPGYAYRGPSPSYAGNDSDWRSQPHHGWRHGDHKWRRAHAMTAPYQSDTHSGWERDYRTPPTVSGYSGRAYSAGSVDQYDYDSGWVENTGAQGAYGQQWQSPRMGFGQPTGPRSGAPPCAQCDGGH